VCDLDVMDAPSKLSVIRKVAALLGVNRDVFFFHREREDEKKSCRYGDGTLSRCPAKEQLPADMRNDKTANTNHTHIPLPSLAPSITCPDSDRCDRRRVCTSIETVGPCHQQVLSRARVSDHAAAFRASSS
jgi:hypothetical protein